MLPDFFRQQYSHLGTCSNLWKKHGMSLLVVDLIIPSVTFKSWDDDPDEEGEDEDLDEDHYYHNHSSLI